LSAGVRRFSKERLLGAGSRSLRSTQKADAVQVCVEAEARAGPTSEDVWVPVEGALC